MSVLDGLDTVTALTTTLVLLNQTDSGGYLHIESERIMHDFFDRLRTLIILARVVGVHDFIDQKLLFFHRLRLRFRLLFSSFLLFLFTCFLLLFLFASVTFDLLFKREFNLDFIVLFEVGGNGNLNNRWVILQVEEELVEVDVDRLGTRVEKTKFFFHLTDTHHCRF